MLSLVSRQLQDFYKVSPMREGILNWYPFANGSSVLEQTNGALTALLCLRCSKVVTLNVDYLGEDKFDYIVVIDPGKITTKLLKQFKSYLNQSGRLLMAFENPYGLQYFAGKRNTRTDLPFTFSRGESKKEVELRLNQAGFQGQKWYYPFSNHYFTREVYSQNYLPNELLNHRGFKFVEEDYTKIFDERGLWKEIVRGGAFEFLCESYLVEARVSSEYAECKVDFATITAYRERDKAVATTINNDGTAQKYPLFEEGITRLKKMRDNHNELSELGVNVIPVEFSGKSLSMKRLDLPTIWDYWAIKLYKGELKKEELFSHYDRIRESILKASGNGKLFWELVPANCFYDSVNDELIFFDQEYFWENVDIDVGVARAIYAMKYSPAFLEFPQSESWIEELKERYGLIEKWDKLAEYADLKTVDYVFNSNQTVALEKARNRVTEREIERMAEHRAKKSLYDKMLTVVGELAKRNFSQPVIYGYGTQGKMLHYAFENSGMDIVCIIDRKKPSACGTPLFEDVNEIPDNFSVDIIIVTSAESSNIIVEGIKAKTKYPVVTIKELTYV